jgi:hypothetical protein
MPPAGSRAAGAATASDRRQSTRQGRTTVRPTNYYARTFAGRLANGLEQTPESSNSTSGFMPALTHFTQAVDAFPKELIKHFSMFKEVEAKFHDPEHELKLLFDEIAQLSVTTKGRQEAAARNHTGRANSANISVNGSMMDGAARHQQLAVDLYPADFNSLPPEEQADLKKRQLFYRLRIVVASMIPTLDEKLVVLTSAKTTMDKGLARMNNSYHHLDSEISEEARYGSLSHWAYADKEEKKKGGQSHERHRREVVSANNLAAAAQAVHEADSTAAAKSEARREAMLANKRSRQQHVDSDFDDRPVKKTQKRKAIAADIAVEDARGIGLGITANGVAPQGKRKKTEKALAAAVAAAPPMERSLSSLVKTIGTGGRNGTSPRATPGADNGGAGAGAGAGTGAGTGKRKPRAPPAPAPRKHALPAYSPPLASSPVAPTFAVSKTIAAERPGSSRARKNSTANSVASAAIELPIGRRPSSSHSIRPPVSSNVIAELEQAAGYLRDTTSFKDEPTPKEPVDLPTPLEPAPLKHEETEPQEPESMHIDVPAPTPTTTTRAGRASKTATPIIGTFPDLPVMARSRSTRNANNGSGNGSNSHASSENNSTTTGVVSKRGHKKNAPSITAAPIPSPALKATTANTKSMPPSNPPSSTASSVAPDAEFSAGEEDDDGDEPRYCYCNEVSYGNMIACDYSECPREWFHLACVNMEKAPNARTKWFCSDECKEANARAKPVKGGRPGSSNKQ